MEGVFGSGRTGIVAHGVFLAEILEQRRQRGEAMPDGGAGRIVLPAASAHFPAL